MLDGRRMTTPGSRFTNGPMKMTGFGWRASLAAAKNFSLCVAGCTAIWGYTYQTTIDPFLRLESKWLAASQ